MGKTLKLNLELIEPIEPDVEDQCQCYRCNIGEGSSEGCIKINNYYE